MNAAVVGQGSGTGTADWSNVQQMSDSLGNTAAVGGAAAGGTGLSVAGVHADGSVDGLESRV